MFSIIAAIGKNNELGKDGKLIWNLPNDLKFFKEKTMEKKIFMGKNTFLSLPKKLPKRIHYIITDGLEQSDDEDIIYLNDIEKFILDNKDTDEEIFVIGGGMVYKQLLPYAKKMYLTEIDAKCMEADTFFPQFDKENYKRKIISKNSDNGIEYTHVEYIKK